MKFLSLLLFVVAASVCSAQRGKPAPPTFPGGVQVGMTLPDFQRAIAKRPLSGKLVKDTVDEEKRRHLSYAIDSVFGVASDYWECVFSSGRLTAIVAPTLSSGVETNVPSFLRMGDSLQTLLGIPKVGLVDFAFIVAGKMLADSGVGTIGEVASEIIAGKRMAFLAWYFALPNGDSVTTLLHLDPESSRLYMATVIKTKD